MPTIIRLSIPLRRPVFSAGFRTQEKLIQLKAVLSQNGINDLGRLGKLRLGDGNSTSLVPTPGFLVPPRGPINILGPQLQLRGIRIPSRLPLNIGGISSDIRLETVLAGARYLRSEPNRAPLFLFGTSVSVPMAYWVATEIEITNNTTVVFTSDCKHLYIVANKVTIGQNVSFTWAEPQYNNDISKRPTPSQPRQDALPNSTSDRIHGTLRTNGTKGIDGVNGVDAPFLQIWTLDLTGKPVILFSGQAGQDGQDGQDGSKGQNGANGISGKVHYTAGTAGLWCDRLAGSGGNGARGGNGGDGGTGGNGGAGGQAEFYVPDPIRDAITGNGFYCDLTGGEKGEGGDGGRGGDGGEGGVIGRTDRSVLGGADVCVCGPAQGAVNGSDGARGADGHPGPDGADGSIRDASIRFVTIDANDFNRQLASPAITTIDKHVVTAGEQITISGLNFTGTDMVMFDNHEVNPVGIRSDTLLTCSVPSIDGGDTDVLVQQTDGTKSNIFSIVIKPVIASVKDVSAIPQAGNRIRPGRMISIKGSGFSTDTQVFIENVPLSDFSFIDKGEVRVRLRRPFAPDVLANAAGENANIKARIPATRAGGVESNAFGVVLDTFRLLVLGDSVAWGQGLQEHEKFHTILENEIRSRAGGIGVYKNVLAHSGAIIGANDDRTDPAIAGQFGGEVPTNGPTLREQVKLALNGAAKDETIDLVLLVGGINDIDAANALSPIGPALPEPIRVSCYVRMKELLKIVCNDFPNARVIVAGYALLISDQSNLAGILPIVMTGLGLVVAGVPGAVGGVVLGVGAEATIKQRSRELRDGMHQKIKEAIADLMIEENSANGRIFFADPDYRDEHAVFAPNALLFNINPDLTPRDNDFIIHQRALVCDANPNRTGPHCPIASTGHPTPAGAARYGAAIIAQLRIAMPELFA
jgi:lysophospholipase L1-like esterase